MDKVEKFGNIVHNMVGRVEAVMATPEHQLDFLGRVAAANLASYEEIVKSPSSTEDLTNTLFNFVEVGMVGHLYIQRSTRANALANQMTDLYARKNADYGNSFDRSMDKFGLVVSAIRIGDKVNRLASLIAKHDEGEVKDESIADTFIDLACYAVMTLMWMHEKGLTTD